MVRKNWENNFLSFKKMELNDSELIKLSSKHKESNYKKGKGICTYCGCNVLLLKKTGKHLRAHYYRNNSMYGNCSGSRSLDYNNRKLSLISESLKKI